MSVDVDIEKMTRMYLALWKLVDIHFPGHHWLALGSDSQEELEKEISRTAAAGLDWAENVEALRKDIELTLSLVRSHTMGADWMARADPIRESLQDKALKYAAVLSTLGDGFFIGESLVGDGNELAHIDLIIGSKSGPAGQAFCQAFSNQSERHLTILAVVAPNLPAKPDALLFNKVTIKDAQQVMQMHGPAQAAVARAVVDSVSSGVIPRDRVDDYCVLVGVFIHWQAKDDKKIFKFNYQATYEAIERALKRQPKVDAVISGAKTARHPLAGRIQ